MLFLSVTPYPDCHQVRGFSFGATVILGIDARQRTRIGKVTTLTVRIDRNMYPFSLTTFLGKY